MSKLKSRQLTTCLEAASIFLLDKNKAKNIITNQISVIQRRFDAVCNEAKLSEVDRKILWRRQFMNPFAFYGLPADDTISKFS